MTFKALSLDYLNMIIPVVQEMKEIPLLVFCGWA